MVKAFIQAVAVNILNYALTLKLVQHLVLTLELDAALSNFFRYKFLERLDSKIKRYIKCKFKGSFLS